MARTNGRCVGLVVLLAIAISGCGGPPQMGADREVFTTIDALYTAVSMREPKQLDRCARSLDALRDAGRLPNAARDALAHYIDDARAGHWENAQSGLREFMLGQRRS